MNVYQNDFYGAFSISFSTPKEQMNKFHVILTSSTNIWIDKWISANKQTLQHRKGYSTFKIDVHTHQQHFILIIQLLFP